MGERMERYCLICNPTAKSGAAQKSIDDAVAALTLAGADFVVRRTEYMGHATALAAEAIAEGFDCIVAVGGDGTIRETALSVVHTDKVLGIIPCGTGNDYVRPLGIPLAVSDAVDTLLHGTDLTVDAGQANEQIFFNVAGFGFDVDVLDYTEQYKPICKGNGSLAYILGVLKAVFGLMLRPSTIAFEDGTVEQNVLLAVAGNGQYFGGGMRVTPEADMTDGLLDLCIAHDVTRRKLLQLLSKFIKGEHTALPYITYRKARRVSIVCDPVSRIEVDGERMQGTPVVFQVLPKAMRVRVPNSVLKGEP